MFKNLFSKLLASYLFIILITLLAVGIATSQLFANYYYSAKEKELICKGQEIADLLTGYPETRNGDNSLDIILNTLSQFLEARTVLVDREGLMLGGGAGLPGPRQLRLEAENIDQVLNGQVVSQRGFSPRFNQAMLTVAVPLKLNNQTTGALLIFSPVDDMKATVNAVRRLIFWAAGAAVLLAALVGYLLSRSIARPLQRMSEITLEMARGNFRQRIEVTSGDELGRLAENFNNLAVNLDQTVSALSREKGKMENILANMVEGVIAVDGEGRVILANARAEETLGVSGHEIVSRPLSDIPGCPELARLFEDVRVTGDQRTLELPPGQSRQYILAHVSPLREEGGRGFFGAVGVLQDVSELRQLEQLRRDFVANVSHELRTPLTSIQGFLEAMMDGIIAGDTAKNRYIQVIHQETLRMNRLIHDLLDLSLLESGKIRWEFGSVNLSDLSSRVLLNLEPQLERRKLAFINNLPTDLPPVRGDGDRIGQVLTNIVANAIQYSPVGGTISLNGQTGESFIKVSISDQGSGIPPEDLSHIWDRFHRVEKSRNRATGGTGLGLSIVKQIVEVHGGFVEAQSDPGMGSTFSFTLPIFEPDKKTN